MIRIGLAGWGDQVLAMPPGIPAREKLRVYAAHFSVVEVDSSFYAVQPARNYAKWAEETPPDFAFVVKAYQGMTGHLRGDNPFPGTAEMFAAFRESVEPLLQAGKLRLVLFQYPPWFDCRRENVDKLRQARALLGDLPLALEFRHQSWFAPEMRDRTLAFMRRERWAHGVCDEPQAGLGSVPIVLEASDDAVTLVRFHGRNVSGWNSGGSANWRDVRYLYRYDEAELREWAQRLVQLQAMTKDIYVIFNNNSGGDAAGNAKQMMRILGQAVYEPPEEKRPPEPEQLDLFSP
ncbi:MAG: DUF72 domain-containing protein [Paenibacillaceae bacterium]|nr:DUF72 domain-containing protein [Paenibacillaceae bacterium]